MQTATEMQTATTVETQASPSKLPAPLWHLLLVVAYLVVPFQWMPWASKLASALHGAGRLPTYFLELEFQWLFLTFVCIGIFFRNGRIRDLIGTLWKSGSEFLRDSGIGLLFMFINLVAVFVLVAIFGVTHQGQKESLPGFLPRNFVEFLAFTPIAITAGIGEEIIFRGYLQKLFRSMTGNIVVAVILQAVIFALAHGYRQDLVGAADKLLVGIAFGILAIARRSLLPGIMAHSFIDMCVGFLSAGLL